MVHLEDTMSDLRTDIDAKHKQNRGDIHALRNGQQETIDKSVEQAVKGVQQEMIEKIWEKHGEILTALGPLNGLPQALERLNNAVDERCRTTEKQVTDLRLQLARAWGYVGGMAVAAGAFYQLASEGIHWLIRH